MLGFEDYQFQANETSGAKGDFSNQRLAIAGLGLAGESGEVADLIKKILGHGHQLDVDKIATELGDLLWYIAEICTTLQLDMENVAHQNLVKLQKRYPGGFSSERSINRES